MRFVVDVNLAPAWADRLRALGHDAQHWSQIGALDATDSEILASALEHDTIVVSCDLDFGAILAASQACAPSVVIRLNPKAPTGCRCSGVRGAAECRCAPILATSIPLNLVVITRDKGRLG